MIWVPGDRRTGVLSRHHFQGPIRARAEASSSAAAAAAAAQVAYNVLLDLWGAPID